MTFLQAQDAITVSTLPHPISMFFLGVSFIISLYLYFELTRLRGDVRAVNKENTEVKEKIRNTKIELFTISLLFFDFQCFYMFNFIQCSIYL